MIRTSRGLLLGLLLAAAPLCADILYNVTDLGVGSAYGMNNAGQVTGVSNGRAFLYTDGRMEDLNDLIDPTLHLALRQGFAINNSGQVTGSAYPSGGVGAPHGFLYSPGGQLVDLGPYTEGYGINNAGQVTGYIGFPGAVHAFLYTDGQMVDVGRLLGSAYNCRGLSINDAGQITGFFWPSQGASIPHAFLYTQGQIEDLGTLGGIYSYGYAINNAGQVTGYSFNSAGVLHAFLDSNGRMEDLGELAEGHYSKGTSINNAGQVVGWAYTVTNSYYHAMLYSNGHMYDLNDLIDPRLGITLTEATAINDSGQIVANTTPNGHAYLLTPVPEPGTLALLAVALLGLGMGLRSRPNVFRAKSGR